MNIFRKTKNLSKRLGPGIITGAADDDPSGIATYLQTGAQFGFSQLWTAAFMYPFMLAVQEASARIGAVTGKGLAEVIKEYYGKKLLYVCVFLLLVANTINIGADIGAVAAAMNLLVPINVGILAIVSTAMILILEIFLSYKRYSQILKWLSISLLCYPIIALITISDYREVLISTFVPKFEFTFQFIFIITAVFGTTISPYMFFWEASEEVEEERASHLINRFGVPHLRKYSIRNLRIDNATGMLISNIATWSIIVTGATVFHSAGVFQIDNAVQAAHAIEPLVKTFPMSGELSKIIFAIGIIGLGFLSIPVLSGSASYALSETLNWKEGLNKKFKRAKGFYGIIIISTLIGLFMNFIGVNPFQALVFAAVLNGILSAPLLFMIFLISRNKKILGEYTGGGISSLLIFSTTFITSIMTLGIFLSYIFKF